MRASVVRAADKSQLYLAGCPDGSWQVINVIASGRWLDPGLRALLGHSLSAEQVLDWAGGKISTSVLGGSAEGAA